MADPDKKGTRNEADDEFDQALGSLSVNDAPLPKVSAVKDLVPHPEADAEFEAALAPKKVPEAQMTVGEPEVIKPQPDASGEAAGRGVDAPLKGKSWYSDLLPKFPQQPKDFNPGDPKTDPNYAHEAAGMKHMEAVGERPGWQLASSLSPALAGVGGGPVGQAIAGGVMAGVPTMADTGDWKQSLNAAKNGFGLSALLGGAGQLASEVSKKSAPLADRLMTQTFMTPAQRALYAAQHGGADSIAQLGSDARSAGLYKPTNWLDHLRPTTARRVAENAERVQGIAGKGIDDFENGLAESGVNPEVKVAPISKGLRDQAESRMGGVMDPAAAGDSKTFNKFADAIEGRQAVPATAPGPQPGMNDAEELAAAQAAQPGVTPPRETVPFTDAMRSKRYMADKIKWNQRPGAAGADFSDDAARRFAWSGLKGNIQDSLKTAANQGQIPQEDLLQYFKNNKDFSTAATVQQPAMKMAERAGETGLGLSDLMAGSMTGNPLVSLASRTARGALPATLAGVTSGVGAAAGGMAQGLNVGAHIAPIAVAQQKMPGAPKAEVEKAANTDLKDKVKNWFQSVNPF